MKLLALGMLRFYKRWISPALAPSCRYVPTCSEYAMEAIERYGVLRGGLMAAWRLLRCHPFVKGGYDPVVNTDLHRDATMNRLITIDLSSTRTTNSEPRTASY
jgi:putative membrane protein insertion efficiency factor